MPAKKMQLPDEVNQEINNGFVKKSVFETLNAINVNDKTEKKQNLTYLSWAWAWAEVKKRYPNATYTIERFGENKEPYLYDENLGYIVFTTMTIEGLTHEMWLPVMDGANKAMKNEPYTYKIKNSDFKYAKFNHEDGKYYDKFGNIQEKYITKTVEPATMFDINKTIMRCLVKNIGMFGLGLYIYAGEDLPEDEKPDENNDDSNKKESAKPQKKAETQKMPSRTSILLEISEAKNKAKNMGIDLSSQKVKAFIADRNNGKTEDAEMSDSELMMYLKIINTLIEGKRKKDEANSQIQPQA